MPLKASSLLLIIVLLASCGQGKRLYGHLKKVNKRKSVATAPLASTPTPPVQPLSIALPSDSIMVAPAIAGNHTSTSPTAAHQPIEKKAPEKIRHQRYSQATGSKMAARKKTQQRMSDPSGFIWMLVIILLLVIAYFGFGFYFIIAGIAKENTVMLVIGCAMIGIPLLSSLINAISN